MDVLITSIPEKIPPEIRQLQDGSRPLPADVAFFEEKFTLSGMLKSAMLGLILTIVGLVLMFVFIYLLFFIPRNTVYSSSGDYEFWIGGVGFVFLIGGWLMLKSLGGSYRLMRQQHQGIDTRYGIFLTGDLLVSHNWLETTIIPRPFFKGVVDGAIRYEVGGSVKSFDLPGAIVGKDTQLLEAAVRAWGDRA